MKRPAGQGEKAIVAASSPKKRKLYIAGQGPESILSVLKGEIPKSTFEVMVAILEKRQGGDTSPLLQEYEEVAVQMAGEVITDVKGKIEAEAKEAQAKLISVEAGWAEKSSILEAAQEELTKIKSKIVEGKLGVKTSIKAIESARLEVQKTKAADKIGAGKPKLVSEKIRSLEAVEKDVFQPLKQATAKGAQGRHKLKHLQKVGKQFGFHDVLLNTTMPKVALKCLDKRQTFDRLVLDQMEAEFAKKQVELEKALKIEKSVKLDREVALDMAQKNLADAVREQEVHASRLAEAEKALVLGKQALVAARRDLKKFDKDSRQKIVRESTQLETHLSTFLDGPFAEFKKLEVLLPSQLVKPPSCELQSTETRSALTRALTRIGTMAVPPSPVEMEEDGDKHDADHENAGDDRVEQEDDAAEDEQEDNEEDPDETEQEDDMPLSNAGAPIVFQPP
jgi:hypothetical protein|eukprot:CAMPEP_0169112390 /NCGR_PEP_ID=MMETSP1015-20121227/27613_1 /TAXON_ID=342587 /ORGANISM="Karlodinium micrum, Strain CCMP2283" /LENGTH=450 /DNA_ID=CAMNT_0009174431 /DNA_START=81 /DNA_END=1433 /DNA_ORIENTATION=+